jgi:PAS domain S-box-containing protein
MVYGMVRDASKNFDLPLAQMEILRASFERAPVGISLHAIDGRVLLANPVLGQMLGYSRDELLGRSFSDLFCQHELDRMGHQWLRVMEGQTVKLDTCYRHANGDEIWASLTMSLLEDGMGGRAVLAYRQDITNQRRAEEGLQENAEKFRIAFEHAASGMSIIGADGKYLAVNPAACQILGYSEEELLSGTVNVVTHPDDVQRGLEWIRKCIAGELCEEELEKRFIHKDGHVIWGVVTSTWLRDANGKPRMSVSHLRDITFRKQAELALRESEARLLEAHELSRMGHWQLCPSTGSMIWSPAIVRLLGIDTQDAGPTFAAFLAPVHVEDRATVEAAFSNTATTGESCDLVYRLLLPSGEIRYVRVLARLDDGTLGAKARVTGVLQDVTEMRKAEEERIHLEAQLHQAQRMEAIGQLAGGVAHDFNNLLTAMGANTQLAMVALLPDSPAHEHLMEIRTAIKSATNLTRQLLAFSRRQVVAPRVLDLNEVVRQVSKMLERLLGENLQLTCRLPEGVGPVRIDPGQLDQILINLAVNARDAMLDGGKLTIETANVVLDHAYCRQHSSVAPGPYVRLTITDTGVGMNAEVKRHLFEPFFTTKEVGRGTGLGLATVYGAVKQHGGHIEVHSEPGQGASFEIYLPVVDELVEKTSAEGSPRDVRGPEGLLLVEDDNAIRALAETFLNGLGYTVHAFASGNDALAALHALPDSIALLVTDMVMPGINGRALADQCRQIRPGLKVLFTSGYTQDAVFQRGMLDHSIDFLPKPYSPDDLARRVREALDRS